ncbi:MAG: Small-conductance mechanosensitive channel, partial [Planctomycetota bacterium]
MIMSPSTVSVRLVASVIVGLGMAAAAAATAEPPPAAITTADAAIPPEKLKHLVKPLTKDELAVEAGAWRDLLKQKVAELGSLQSQATQPGQAREVARLQAERTLLSDRLRTVLDEWERKGGDPSEYRLYANAVSGLDVDVSDAGHTFKLLRAWVFSEQGGLRWAWNIVKFVAILAAFWVLSRLLAGLVGKAAARIRGGSSLLKTFLTNFVRQATLAIGGIVALAALEVNISPLLALIGGAAFVVGLALQNTLSNFAQGLIILAYR